MTQNVTIVRLVCGQSDGVVVLFKANLDTGTGGALDDIDSVQV